MFVLFSCQENKTNAKSPEYFFSLKEYFEQEALRLSKAQRSILKKVSRNGDTETKELEIQDWKKEFGLFIESDINKLSWKDRYQMIQKGDSTLYQSLDTNLRTQQIILVREDHEIKEVLIKNKVNNQLYTSLENLSYYPDSLYLIQKTQKVWFLGANSYEVSGHFTP